MHILFPLHSLERGGGCRVVAEAANGLTAYGHHVTVALPDGAPVAWPLTAEIVRIPFLSAGYFPPAEVIIPTFYTTLPAAIESHVPIIRFCLGFEPLWVPDPEVALDGYRLSYPIITISRCLQNLLLARVRRQSHLVHPGVDSAAFRPCGNKGLYGRPTVAFILRGPIYTYKGIGILWESLALVYKERPDLKLLIIANDEAADPHTDIPHQILRSPGDEDLGRILSAADVFVFPSMFEGFGLPPLEAMACGTAVVCTDSGGSREYAVHERNCLLVPTGQAWPLAQAILRLLRDQGLRERLIEIGKATAAGWTWFRFYQEIHRLIQALTMDAYSHMPPCS